MVLVVSFIRASGSGTADVEVGYHCLTNLIEHNSLDSIYRLFVQVVNAYDFGSERRLLLNIITDSLPTRRL